PYMLPKQTEMDKVVGEIYRALESKKHLQTTLLVLCGDHGMTDAGNHGGSAEGETSPALVFVSPKLRRIFQGVECPTTSPAGSLSYYAKVDQSDIAPTLAGLVGFPVPKNNLGVFIPDFLRFWTKHDRVRLMKQNAEQVLGIVKETFPTLSYDGAQSVMSNTASNYSVGKLYGGAAIATLATLWTFLGSFPILWQKRNFGMWFMLVTLAYGIIMFASSYVEEEHQFWYLVASTWLAWLEAESGLKPGRESASTFKVSFTVADSPELLRGMEIFRPGVLNGLKLLTQARAVFLGMVIYAASIALPIRGKRHDTSHGERRVRLKSCHGILALFLLTQSRVTNIPLFALFEIQMQALASRDLSAAEISLTSIILQYASFFAFGGSNAISSVDLSNAYNGVSGYNAGAVGFLTFCGNWAGPIWWTTATLILLGRDKQDLLNGLRHFQLLSTYFYADAILFVMLACTLLRTHLFVWTVFSPKYLYTLAWSLGQHLCINIAAVELYIWLGYASKSVQLRYE
ncbi:MAG: hypothetical protein Q9166_006388, partial [cf. Caloplaca sp. 2 TL-2023]